MSEQEFVSDRYEEWLKDESEVAALVMRQWLEPVEGKDAVIFPPTYATPQGTREEDWMGYNIDRFPDGSSVCQVDSVGSQANRMEPIFKREPYSKLVPQVVISAGQREVNLLDASHRAADAVARFSTLGPQLHEAFQAFQERGNAEPLAKIAPTSIVFGSWDSRATYSKLPRVVRSVIRAYDIEVLHRSAQYTTMGLKAELGLAHVPPVRTHGGIMVKGETRRDAALNLSAVRALAGTDTGTLKLRRYILGLALVSFTAPLDMWLREGCQLVPAADHPAEWRLVRHDGRREPFSLSHEDAVAYAQKAATAFGVGQNETATFDSQAAKKALAPSKKAQ